MAEATVELPQSIEKGMESETRCPEKPMDSGVENQLNGVEKSQENEDGGGLKRGREDGGDEKEDDGVSKKQMVEPSVVEEKLEEKEERGEEEEKEDGGGDDDKGPANVSLGPKVFGSSAEMFDYFLKLLHFWTPNRDLNKYEHMVLLELLKQGHADADTKMGDGIQAFQVRYHPAWKSRCFFLIRVDGSTDDFSFRKCVDHIVPLPDNMKVPGAYNGKNDGKKNGSGGGHYKGRGGGGGGGGGRGGRGRGGGRGGQWHGKKR